MRFLTFQPSVQQLLPSLEHHTQSQTPELSDNYRDVLYNLLEVADVAGGTPELNEAIARLRDAALHTLGSTGFKQFFPTSEQQTRVFSELVNQGDSLSEGKKKVLNQLVVHAAPSILASMSKAEDDSMDDAEVQASLASKLEFLSSLLMQVTTTKWRSVILLGRGEKGGG